MSNFKTTMTILGVFILGTLSMQAFAQTYALMAKLKALIKAGHLFYTGKQELQIRAG